MTRQRILRSAFTEFYQNGFQGGSLNRIVAEAGTTKGGLFHHFDGKQDLGYRVVDEVIRPHIQKEWIDPLLHCTDPVSEIKRILRASLAQNENRLCQGCPLNNLAQEMSPLDDEFRRRIQSIYDEWRGAISTAFRNGLKQGTVQRGIVPERIAAFVVAALTGMIGTAKNAASFALLKSAADELIHYLDGLKQ